MSRRKGRILAFQALYSHDVGEVPLDELLRFEWDKKEGSETEPDSYDFARILVSGTINYQEEIDALIKKHLSDNWDFERVNKVSLAILRISIFTLLFQKDVHPSIVIDEAIAIAKDYGETDSFRFINAVLDNIRKETAS